MAAFSSARPVRASPLTRPNRPATTTPVPSGAGASAVTGPSSAGAAPRMRPVPSSKAKRCRRRYRTPVPASATWLKLPPTTTVEPTTAIAVTVPSSTFGVHATGRSLTTPGWASPAVAGPAPARASRNTAAASRRRFVDTDSQRPGLGPRHARGITWTADTEPGPGHVTPRA
ncbi:hypothetical protein ACPPVO_38920 [Dactylosporangium sp. McL0621]|uniref:hypothetical protein n=1 Tax=Dactylosporangium sp. McL0621 TaxID=3415678 RepID=UPI003CED4A84